MAASCYVAVIMGGPEWMTNAYLEVVAKKMYPGAKVQVQDSDISSASVNGDGYTCHILRIKLTLLLDGVEKKVSLIGKLLPKTTLSEELTKHFNIFQVEVNFLMDAWPKLQAKFPDASFAPKAYHLDEEHKTLFMEDLCASGFKMISPEKGATDLEHSLLFMNLLGKFHAYSYLLLQDCPQLKETFSEYFWKRREHLGVDLQLSVVGLDLMLEKIDKWTVSEDIKTRLRKLQGGKILELGYKAFERKETGINVLTHGDCWLNNMMFKYDDKGKVQDVKLFDYQFSSYNAIGIDLNFYIFTSLDERVQMGGLQQLFEEYYKAFTSITGPVPGFTIDTVWKEFYDHLGLGFICYYIFRAGIIGAPIALDLDSVIEGVDSEINRGLFQSDLFISEGSRMLPFFAEHGLI